ncbi:MAG: hypothetical protein ACI923_002798 [Flavobacteriales bacterium]|jgi:hypothetical protein
MHTHADKTQENKSQSVANTVPQKQNGGETTFQFVDNRPEAVTQRKSQEIANNSLQVSQLRASQDMANNSGHAEQVAQLQPMADNASSQQQEPTQKKENNTGLPDNLKTGMESLSGMPLDDVKVHRNSDKPAQLQAHAYAQGTDIHLGPGQEKHLPHEAWHVVQQKQGRVNPTMQMKGKVNVNDDAGLEKEADIMGANALVLHSETTTKDNIGANKNISGNNTTVQRAKSNTVQMGRKSNVSKVLAIANRDYSDDFAEDYEELESREASSDEQETVSEQMANEVEGELDDTPSEGTLFVKFYQPKFSKIDALQSKAETFGEKYTNRDVTSEVYDIDGVQEDLGVLVNEIKPHMEGLKVDIMKSYGAVSGTSIGDKIITKLETYEIESIILKNFAYQKFLQDAKGVDSSAATHELLISVGKLLKDSPKATLEKLAEGLACYDRYFGNEGALADVSDGLVPIREEVVGSMNLDENSSLEMALQESFNGDGDGEGIKSPEKIKSEAISYSVDIEFKTTELIKQCESFDLGEAFVTCLEIDNIVSELLGIIPLLGEVINAVQLALTLKELRKVKKDLASIRNSLRIKDDFSSATPEMLSAVSNKQNEKEKQLIIKSAQKTAQIIIGSISVFTDLGVGGAIAKSTVAVVSAGAKKAVSKAHNSDKSQAILMVALIQTAESLASTADYKPEKLSAGEMKQLNVIFNVSKTFFSPLKTFHKVAKISGH